MNLTPELLARLESLLDRAELLLPETPVEPDWSVHRAARWRKRAGRGFLQPVAQPHALRLEDLQCIERAKTELDRNIRQFVAGYEAERCPLWLWEEAILQGYAAFRFLRERRRGRIRIDMTNHRLSIETLP